MQYFSSWLYDLCRGVEHEPVKPRQLPKSIGCSKNFPGTSALVTQKQVSDCEEDTIGSVLKSKQKLENSLNTVASFLWF